MIETKTFKKAFGQPLLACGYRRKGPTWYKDAGNITLIVNLQKSQFANEYFINLAFNFKELTGEDVVPEHKCHVRLRVKDASFRVCHGVNSLLCLDSTDFSSEHHVRAVSELSNDIVSFMDDLSSVERIAAAHLDGRLEGAAVRRTVLPILDAAAKR
jgi:hypothetical protein